MQYRNAVGNVFVNVSQQMINSVGLVIMEHGFTHVEILDWMPAQNALHKPVRSATLYTVILVEI